MLVYNVPITSVKTMERTISGYLCRWLGLPCSRSSADLYRKNNILQLPFDSIMEEFKVSRTREALQYRDSNDPTVSEAGIEIHTGRKWSATRELERVEARLRHKVVVGAVVIGRTGLASFHLNTTMSRVKRSGCLSRKK